MDNLKLAAEGKWLSILSNYIPKEFLTGKHTKCPFCGGKDRFRVDRNGGYICNQCGAGTGLHFIAQFHGVNHAEAWRMVEKVIGTATTEKQPEQDRKQIIADILSRAMQPGEEVKKYLSSRCIDEIPESALQSSYYMNGEMTNCMVFKAAKGNKLVGLHATYLCNGEKTGRRMYAIDQGAMVGSAIRLHKLNGGDSLIVGEGIETCLSASKLFHWPAWAAMDAGKLEQIEIPDQVNYVCIAADNDTSFTGQAAAYKLAKRLKGQGKKVKVMLPEKEGTDWNDYLKENINRS